VSLVIINSIHWVQQREGGWVGGLVVCASAGSAGAGLPRTGLEAVFVAKCVRGAYLLRETPAPKHKHFCSLSPKVFAYLLRETPAPKHKHFCSLSPKGFAYLLRETPAPKHKHFCSLSPKVFAYLLRETPAPKHKHFCS